MKKSVRVFAVLIAVILLLSNAAFAARLTAGDVAKKMAGTYFDNGQSIYYKISPSGNDMKIEAGPALDNIVTSMTLYDYDVVSVDTDGTKIMFVESALPFYSMCEFELLPNGNIVIVQTIASDTETMEIIKLSGPDTGDTTNAVLPGVMMLVAAAGIVIASKKRAQY